MREVATIMMQDEAAEHQATRDKLQASSTELQRTTTALAAECAAHQSTQMAAFSTNDRLMRAEAAHEHEVAAHKATKTKLAAASTKLQQARGKLSAERGRHHGTTAALDAATTELAAIKAALDEARAAHEATKQALAAAKEAVPASDDADAFCFAKPVMHAPSRGPCTAVPLLFGRPISAGATAPVAADVSGGCKAAAHQHAAAARSHCLLLLTLAPLLRAAQAGAVADDGCVPRAKYARLRAAYKTKCREHADLIDASVVEGRALNAMIHDLQAAVSTAECQALAAECQLEALHASLRASA